jgi:hypothetical protein
MRLAPDTYRAGSPAYSESELRRRRRRQVSSRIASVQRRKNGRPVVGDVSGTVVRDVSISISFALASLVSRFRLQTPCLIGLLPALVPPLLEHLTALLIRLAVALVPPLLERLTALLIRLAVALVPPLLERLTALLIRLAVALVPPLLERLTVLLIRPTPALLSFAGCVRRLECPPLFLWIQD